MRVGLTTDEMDWVPVYEVTTLELSAAEVEIIDIPEERIEWARRVTTEFRSVQSYLREELAACTIRFRAGS